MLLTIKRYLYGDAATLGLLLIDGAFQCYTLERPRLHDGKENVPDLTCIPEGEFRGVVSMSQKRGYNVPHILDVPGRSAIEIHILNYPTQSEGCVGVGAGVNSRVPALINSASAFGELMDKLAGGPWFTVEVTS